MGKYRTKAVIVEATQFRFIDGYEGSQTCLLAESLGMSRNLPYSKVWEIKTLGFWRMVDSGDWIITDAEGGKHICRPDVFDATYEPATTGDKEGFHEQQIQNLENALKRMLIAVGVMSTDIELIEPTGPELIIAAEEYIAFLGKKPRM